MCARTGGGGWEGGGQPNVDRPGLGEGGGSPKNSQICADILYGRPPINQRSIKFGTGYKHY